MKKAIKENGFLFLIFLTIIVVAGREIIVACNQPKLPEFVHSPTDHWVAPSLYLNSTEGFNRQEIIYGEDLIANTARYFGPKGSVAQMSNGMNCQNCHLQAGTKPWGSNFGGVFSIYPKFNNRSGKTEGIESRVNDCFERSLNGSALDTAGKEMRAMVAYISWLGRDVPHGTRPKGSGIAELPYPDHAADPGEGQRLYAAKCARCHGAEGQGVSDVQNIGYLYPPVWGPKSYNTGAGLFRLSKLAGFIKDNMPFDIATHTNPALTDEEAWNIAAFVNTQPRPQKNTTQDWPDISKKPIDHPFGPYSDSFSETQHKFGPFKPIAAAHRQ